MTLKNLMGIVLTPYVGVLVCVFVLLAPSASADEIDEARHLLGGEQHAEAVKRIRAAIAAYEKQPDDARAQRRAGVGWFYLQEDDKARARLARAIELDSQDPQGHYWLGVLLQYSDLEAAAKAMAKACELAPAHAPYAFEQGQILRRLKQPEKALAAYRRAVAADAKHAEAHMRVGTLLLRDDRTKAEGIRALERALALDPDLLLARYNAGLHHYLAGAFDKALVHFAYGAKHLPDDFDFQKKTIQALYALGRGDEAGPYRDRLVAIRKGMEEKPRDFCFDQFRVGALRVMAYERFEKEGDLYYHYVFKVYDAEQTFQRSINLESSAVLRELGQAYILGMSHADGSHETLGPTWTAMPDYAALKELVRKAADGSVRGGFRIDTKKKSSSSGKQGGKDADDK